jgi:uncharacterized repeat protein (TIGR01451 family)
MRRFVSLLLALVVASVGLTALGSAAGAASTIVVTNGVTDNYKAAYNADPTVQENRSWLQLTTVTVDGVSYRPRTLPATFLFTDAVEVVGSDGSTGTFTVSVPGDRGWARYRVDPSGGWGPLLNLFSPATLQGNPVPVTLTLSKGGVPVATTVATYTWDQALSSVPATSVEYKSPGGRFWFGCKPTRADWEAAAPADTCAQPTTGAKLAVTVTSTSNVAVGNTFRYTVTVTNSGTGPASDVSVADALPATLRAQAVFPGTGVTCTGTATVTCRAATLPAGGRLVVGIDAAAVAPGSLTNTVSANASLSSTTAWNATASRTVVSEGFACTVVGTPGADTMVAPSATRAVLCGLGGNDRISGAGGNDQLYGGHGNDTLLGNAGDDVLTGGPGDDTTDGGSHVVGDRISYADARSSIVVNMGQLHAWDDGAVAGDAMIGYDAMNAVEGVIGSPFADQLLGGAGNDRIEGVGGNDLIYGYGGDDVLDGGVGADAVYGQAGNDTLRGHNGNDNLSGGTGADALDGQADTDTCVTGGNTGDTKASCEK